MQKEILIAIVLLVLLGVFAFWPEEKTEEQQIQLVIDQIEAGMEEANLSLVMKQISKDYSDAQGLSKRSIKGILFQQFQKRGKIGITLSPMSILIEGTQADVEAEALIIEGSILGFSADADAIHIDIELQKEQNEWKIISHSRTSLVE